MAVTIGLVGAGRRAIEVYAPALASCEPVDFAGVWSRSPDSGRALAERHHVPAYARYAELLDHCDAVAFAVPPPVQAELAATAARQGLAVLLDKPIAGDLAGAEELTEAVAAKSVVSQVALVWRYSRAVRTFLGVDVPRAAPAGGHGRFIGPPPAPPRVGNPWPLERGILLSHGPDILDLLGAALGPVVGVRAHGDPRGWIGLILDHQVGRFSEASLYAGAAATSHRAEVEVFGPDGEARIDCTRAADTEAFDTMFREFAEAVELGRGPELDVRHGLHLQRVIEAAGTDLAVGA